MSLKAIPDCEYSVFISYAHDDDAAWNRWVTHFDKELNSSLKSRLGSRNAPNTHLSGRIPLLNGSLDDGLKQRVAASFAMVIVVHDRYAESEWCLKELQHFRSTFGREGLSERLYIVALSRSAIERVSKMPEWQAAFPGGDQVWLPFFQDDEPDQPLPVYEAKELLAAEFQQRFLSLREDLYKKMSKGLLGRAATGPVAPRTIAVQFEEAGEERGEDSGAEPGEAAESVRLYIESNGNERTLWKPLGEQIRKKWDKVVQDVSPGMRPPLQLRSRGLPVDQIHRLKQLPSADGVVLLWGKKDGDAVLAQIDMVERKLPPGAVPPSIVAYLMPPQALTDRPVPAWGWDVLRFANNPDRAIDVVPDELPDLEAFLREILARKRAEGHAQGLAAAGAGP